MIITGILSGVSAITVARIKGRPEMSKNEVEKFSFFYEQYRILYEEAVNRVDDLQVRNDMLTSQVDALEKENKELEALFKENQKDDLYDSYEKDKRIKELEHELQYWKDEAEIGYMLLSIEEEEDKPQ